MCKDKTKVFKIHALFQQMSYAVMYQVHTNQTQVSKYQCCDAKKVRTYFCDKINHLCLSYTYRDSMQDSGNYKT